MSNRTEHGVLLLADISGFTAFVSATALEHGPAVIADLLESVMRELSPPLDVQEVEGDAVFFVGSDRAVVPPDRLLHVIDDAFSAFRKRRRLIAADASCVCEACSTVGRLELKIVVHHGRFLRQRVGGRGQLAGVDVILAHQLLKNRVGKRAYLLLTEAAVQWIGVDASPREFSPHVEQYEYLGDVRCFVKDVHDPAALTVSTAA